MAEPVKRTTKRATTKKNLPALPEPPTLTRGQRKAAEVALALKAREAGFWITTRDESRTELDLATGVAKVGYRTLFWDLARGVTSINGKPYRDNPSYDPPESPDDVLDLIEKKSKQRLGEKESDRTLWILRGFAPWLDGVGGALTLRKLQNLVRPDGLAG